ncbi:DUF3558 family protein [Streptomyces sp. AM 4-1-1]|uniref:DUF3558 family protein n=1 Tax=Streptomyces sp. AM 4-1-1 TaxID=3028710 RepID=UPI0023B9C573|nr:DUF3558 family protein [Streptomyces sp. AM 4-1-1]WEH34075.1 DUF3558 family protein [Streptomyces sp. AM 4-1-1]
MHRSAPRLTRLLACAAIPVMLVVAGCSSDSDGKKDKESSSASSSSSGSASADGKSSEPTVEAAKFATLPDPCKTVTPKTIATLVPKTKNKAGTAGRSSDVAMRGSCSWNGLDDQGVKGSQYRWLDVSLTRFESDQTRGSGAERAQEEFAKQVTKVKSTDGALKVAEVPVTGVGEQATAVTYELTKTDEDFKYATVVTRTGNVVITLTYNGTGYAGAKPPAPADVLKGARTAATEAVASIATANSASTPTGSPSGSPTGAPSASPSGSPSDSAALKSPASPGTSASAKA